MIVVLTAQASADEIGEVMRRIEALGYRPHPMYGVERTVIGCLGDERGKAQLQVLEALHCVEKVIPILTPYKLAAKQLRAEPTVVRVSAECLIGSANLTVIAGPCAVESEEQILEAARIARAAGANALRGGAFKPRSSTYSFQGLGEDGLKMLALARAQTGLAVVTEILDPHHLDLVARYADMLQVGARNMQNFALLKELGAVGKPILLKRGMAATVDEFLCSAEYILAAGNPNVVLCERGIRTFETATRNTLDLNAIPALAERSHLPVLVDPSHGTGVWRYVTAMSRAAVAAGADGLMVEMHPQPEAALSDGYQSLPPEEFERLMQALEPIAAALGKTLARREVRWELRKISAS